MATDAMLRMVPLGGLGQVGGNMTIYETARDLIAVDCGVLFPTAEQPGVDYVIPDITYVLERRDRFRGFVLTHGHEDHLGALGFVLPRLAAPVYGTRLTLALTQQRLQEHEGFTPRLNVIHDREPFALGEFLIDPIPLTHSIPDAVALAMRTPIGTVVHTGDFKIDPNPIDGRLTDLEALRGLGERGVAVLLSDSTNAERQGHTWSEHEIGETLEQLIATAPGRVLVTSFASHLHRAQLVIDSSLRAGRRVMPVGRSMQQNIQLALEFGYLRAPFGSLVDVSEFDHIPPSRLTVIAAGSQGEPQSAMTRIATGQHAHVHLAGGDRVIVSARRIPGNERAVGNMINHLFRLGAEVIDDRLARVHASGHAFNDEQRQMIDLCRPSFFVPIHGEYRHLVRHARLAAEAGIPNERIGITETGTPLEFVHSDGRLQMRRGEPVPAGHVLVDGKGVGDIGEVVLRDRRVLAETGMVLCVVVLAEDGTVTAGPDIVTRGVIHVDANPEIVAAAVSEVRSVLASRHTPWDVPECSEQVRQTLRRFFRRQLNRRPLVLPVVMSV